MDSCPLCSYCISSIKSVSTGMSTIVDFYGDVRECFSTNNTFSYKTRSPKGYFKDGFTLSAIWGYMIPYFDKRPFLSIGKSHLESSAGICLPDVNIHGKMLQAIPARFHCLSLRIQP